MGSLVAYSIVSSVLLAALYLAYKPTLAGEKQFSFNRGVIYTIYILAISLPAFHFYGSGILRNFLHPSHPAEGNAGIEIMLDPDMMQTGMVNRPVSVVFGILLVVYIFGVGVALSRFLWSLYRIHSIVRTSNRQQLDNGYVLVRSPRRGIAPFSWRKYIVIPESERETDFQAIIIHESSHLDHRHWIDHLLANAVAIFQWFNPAAWLMIEELKSVHEFQADDAVITSGVNIKQYQYLLVEKAVGKRFPSPANSLNHSKLKNRITMMYKSNSKSGRRWAVLTAIPAIVAAFAVINVPAFAEVLSETEEATITIPSDSKVTKNIADVKIPSPDALEDVIAESAGGSAEERSVSMATENAEDKSKVKDHKEKKSEQNLEIYVNDRKITSEQMHTLSPSDIKSMNIEKNKEGNPGIIRITLKDGKTLENAIKNPSQAKKQSSGSDEVYVAVEKSAEYPGGQKALMEYLAANVRYPEEAAKKEIQGMVIVKFIVTKSGKILNATVIKGVDPLLDKEAVRIVESMPDWQPAENGGVAVDSYFNIPVMFKLHKQEPKPEADTTAK